MILWGARGLLFVGAALTAVACAGPAPPPVVTVETPPPASPPSAAPATADAPPPVHVAASARCGREPQAMATHQSLLGLAQDRDRVYWSDGAGQVMAVRKDGGEAQLLVNTSLAPQSLTVVGGDVVWIEYGAVQAVRGEGGNRRALATGNGPTMGIAAAGSEVVVVNLDSDTISAVPMAGGAPRVLHQGTTSIRLAADARGAVFWRALARDAYDLSYLPAGGAKPQVLAPHQRFPGPVALDAASVYFDGGTGVTRIPRGGGPPAAVTSEVAREIALDGGSLYFTTEGRAGKLEHGARARRYAQRRHHLRPALRPAPRGRRGLLYFAAKGRIMKVQKP